MSVHNKYFWEDVEKRESSYTIGGMQIHATTMENNIEVS